jgi:hypothetical protein
MAVTPARAAASHNGCCSGFESCYRMFEDMQLEDWTRPSNLTHLSLRRVAESNHGTLVAVLPQMIALRSLVPAEDMCFVRNALPAEGGHTHGGDRASCNQQRAARSDFACAAAHLSAPVSLVDCRCEAACKHEVADSCGPGVC